MVMSSAGAGLGAGLGTLFQALGRQKLQDANNAVMKAKWDQAQNLSNSEIGKNNSVTALNSDKLGALQGIGDALSGLGYTPQQAAAISGYARANGGANLKNATDAAMELQIPVAGTAAVPQLGNTFQQALGRDTSKVADGVAYNPLGDAADAVNVTPVGNAMIAARKAQANASNASAANSYAHARVAGLEALGGAGAGKAPAGYRWKADGSLEPIPGGPADQSPQSAMADPNGAHGDSYLSSIDPTTAAQVKALAEGRMAFPSGTALKSPYWQGMLQHVAQYDPSFDAVNYNARSGTRKAFTSGKEAQTVNALNTVAEHLGTFSDDASDLNNTSFPAINTVKNWIAGQTGDPTIARFNTAKKAVADEVAKVWRASGGSQADIEENLNNLNGAQSPAQLNAAIGTLTQLIHGKIAALQDQYGAGMGTTANPRALISPEAQTAFDKTLSRAGVDTTAFNQSVGAQLPQTGQSAPQGAASPAPAPAPQMARPNTAAEFNALPSGSLYVDPDDGKVYRKP